MIAWRKELYVLLFFTGVSLLMTWPVVANLTTAVAGSGGDPWQTMWRFEDTAASLREAWQQTSLISYLRTELLGGGAPRLVNLSVWPWLPLHFLFGEPVTYNLVWLLSFILSGYCMYLVSRRLIDTLPAPVPAAAPLVAGLAYAFLPYHAAHALGHFGAMQLQWLPLIILLFWRWRETSTPWRTIALGLALCLQAWTEHHYFAWLVVAAIILGMRWWGTSVAIMRGPSRRVLVLLVAIVAIGIIIPYGPTLRLSAQPATPLALGTEQTIRFSADVFAFIVPAVFHPLWGDAVQTLFAERFTGNVSEATHFLGIVPLLLVFFFSARLPAPIRAPWVLLAIIFFVISLGPYLHVFGWVTPIPLPYALIDSLPIFSSIRTVARASALLGVSFCVLLGLVVAHNVKRFSNYLLIGVLIIVEFLFLPFPLQSAQLSPIYTELSHLGGSRVIEIPAATNYVTASRALYASSQHRQEVVGNIALERGEDTDGLSLAKTLPGVRQLLYLRTTDLNENRQEFFGQDITESLPDAMRLLDARAIIIHPDSLTPQQTATLRHFLEERLALTSTAFGDTLLYAIRQAPVASDGFIATRGEGWNHIGLDKARQSIFGEISQQAKVNLYNINPHDLFVTLSITIPPESHGALRATLDGQAVIDRPTAPGTLSSVSFTLPPGKHELVFTNLLTEKVIVQNPRLQVGSQRP